MNFDLSDLRAFVAAADLGSFRAAAEALAISQSALSRRIDKLEGALGVRLFERNTRHIALTTVGRGFLHKARHIIAELESALLGMRDTAERISGELTIACVPSAVAYFLPRVVKEYHAKYPRIRLRIHADLEKPLAPVIGVVSGFVAGVVGVLVEGVTLGVTA